jgi:hypothetical protein
MGSLRRTVGLILLLAMFAYPVKRYFHRLWPWVLNGSAILTEPLKVSDRISRSDPMSSVPVEVVRVSRELAERAPHEVDYFVDMKILSRPLYLQRLIEFNFPKRLSMNARCGFGLNQGGGLHLVCSR